MEVIKLGNRSVSLGQNLKNHTCEKNINLINSFGWSRYISTEKRTGKNCNKALCASIDAVFLLQGCAMTE